MENNIGNTSSSSFLVSDLSVDVEAATMTPSTPSINVTTTNYTEPVPAVEFNPALAAVIVAMVLSFFLVGFTTGFLKRCIRPAEDDADLDVRHRRHSRPGSSTIKPQRGLDPEIVESLPFIQYKDLPADEGLRKYFDCSVCLAAFDASDCLRLLPECSHAFHSDCIDAWFRSNNTCPLCRTCQAHPTDEASREEREGDADDGEEPATRVREGFDVVEVVIGSDLEQDNSGSGSPAISRPSQERTGGAPEANSSSAKEEERVYTHPFLLSNAEGTFKPAVRVVTAQEKAAALVSIRRSNSTGTDLQLLHPSYVVDSEGTQHNRNYQTHAINVEEFLPKGAGQAQSTESLSRHPGSVAQHNWCPVDLEAGGSSVIRPISRLEQQRPWLKIWSYLNLRHIARP